MFSSADIHLLWHIKEGKAERFEVNLGLWTEFNFRLSRQVSNLVPKSLYNSYAHAEMEEHAVMVTFAYFEVCYGTH